MGLSYYEIEIGDTVVYLSVISRNGHFSSIGYTIL